MEYCAGGDLSQKLRAAVERGGAKFSENVRIAQTSKNAFNFLSSNSKIQVTSGKFG
jgi:hypothetical protein